MHGWEYADHQVIDLIVVFEVTKLSLGRRSALLEQILRDWIGELFWILCLEKDLGMLGLRIFSIYWIYMEYEERYLVISAFKYSLERN